MTRTRNQWSTTRWTLCLLLVGLGVLATLDIWADIVRIALRDEEASHILLVPVVAAWLVWVRRSRLRYCRGAASWWGPLLIALGWTLSSVGFNNGTQFFWHGGAVLVLVGCMVTLAGTDPLVKFLPAFLVLVFLLPVPGLVRQQIAIPLQTATAHVTQWVFEAGGATVARSGNVLTMNGVEVAIAEACNGMRMVFSLALVSFAFAFGLPLRNPVRVLVLLASPICAIAANVLRMIPTVWIYGTFPTSVAEAFHDISGWLMLPLAFLVMVGVVRVLRWALVPVFCWGAAAHPPHPTSPMLRRKEYLTAALSLALLAAIGISALGRPSPADAQPYHQRVLRAFETVPQRIGTWVGTDEPLLPAALDLLQPNAVLHRTYRDLNTGQTATLLLVQCKDARDLAGHYPPICYPAHGWRLDHQSPRRWACTGMAVEGTEYEFSYGTIAGAQRMIVANFMILPDGHTSPDMAAVYRVASDYQRRFYGAAQVQIVTDARLPEQQRERIVMDFVGANVDVLQTILSGGTP